MIHNMICDFLIELIWWCALWKTQPEAEHDKWIRVIDCVVIVCAAANLHFILMKSRDLPRKLSKNSWLGLWRAVCYHGWWWSRHGWTIFTMGKLLKLIKFCNIVIAILKFACWIMTHVIVNVRMWMNFIIMDSWWCCWSVLFVDQFLPYVIYII